MAARRKINKAWLTNSEAAEYDRRVRLRAAVAQTGDTGPLPESTRARLRAATWWYLGAGLVVTVLAATIAGVSHQDPAGDPPEMLAMVVGMFTAFMALVIGLFAYQGHVHHAYSLWVAEYLHEISYHTRTGPPGAIRPARPAIAYSSGGPSYPVTDGMYDPDLYSQRGGYATFARMDALGIEDYETYKNNVLEAE